MRQSSGIGFFFKQKTAYEISACLVGSEMCNKRQIRAWLNNLDVDLDKLLDSVIAFFRNGAGNVLNSTVYAIGSIVNGVTTFVIAFVFACYILLQKEKLGVQVKKVMHAFLKEKWEKRCLKVCTLTSKTFSNFLTGQCLEALILGSMFFVAMSLFKMPYALLVGVLVAFTALIPIFGAFIGCVVGAFLILMVDPLQALFFVIMFLVLQQIEGNLIYPKVVGNSVGLPSIWVLAAVTIGGSLMGVVGMLIFIPLVSVVYTLFLVRVYKTSLFYTPDASAVRYTGMTVAPHDLLKKNTWAVVAEENNQARAASTVCKLMQLIDI